MSSHLELADEIERFLNESPNAPQGIDLLTRAAAEIRKAYAPPAKTGIDAEVPELDDHIGWIQYQCAAYWNEHRISDAEVHKTLEGIYRHATNAAAEIRALVAEIGEWREEEDLSSTILTYHIKMDGEWREPGARGREIVEERER